MRLWVPHEKRRPQPEPLRTNDLLAFQVGLGLWLVALIIALGMLATPVPFDPVQTLATIALGLLLGLAGLLVSRRARR